MTDAAQPLSTTRAARPRRGTRLGPHRREREFFRDMSQQFSRGQASRVEARASRRARRCTAGARSRRAHAAGGAALLPALSLFSGGGGSTWLRAGRLRARRLLRHAGGRRRDAPREPARGTCPSGAEATFATSTGGRTEASWLSCMAGRPASRSRLPAPAWYDDARNMLPEFVRAVRRQAPRLRLRERPRARGPEVRAHICEITFFGPLSRRYHSRVQAERARLRRAAAASPGLLRRLPLARALATVLAPAPTHRADHLGQRSNSAGRALAARPDHGRPAALGLPGDRLDALAPTLRSTLTGPRHTTSITEQRVRAAALGRDEASGRTASRGPTPRG